MITPVVALFVDRQGGYPGRVPVWYDERKDARSYTGDLPVVGIVAPFDLRWTLTPYRASKALVSWCGNRGASGERRPRLGHREAIATPPEFRETLIKLATHARGWS